MLQVRGIDDLPGFPDGALEDLVIRGGQVALLEEEVVEPAGVLDDEELVLRPLDAHLLEGLEGRGEEPLAVPVHDVDEAVGLEVVPVVLEALDRVDIGLGDAQGPGQKESRRCGS